MTDILTITLNPAVDVATSTPRLEPAHKLRCGDPRRYAGGGGINVTRVLHRLGADSLALYLAGGAIGQQLRRLVAREGIQSHSLAIADETRESFSVLETSTGREYRFVLPGPTVQAREWEPVLDYLRAQAAPPRYVVLSGTLPPGVPSDAYARLAEAAKARGSAVILDSSGPELREALHQGVLIVKPSLRELSELTGRALRDEVQWLDAAQQLVRDGQARMVALSLGERGALLAGADGAWAADALPVRVASATGAGDSFLAALVWALASGQQPVEALRYAVAAGSAAVLSAGTELSSRHDTLRLAPQVVVRSL